MKGKNKYSLRPFLEYLSNFRWMCVAILFLCIANVVVYFIISIWPNLLSSLQLSSSQPHGIITAIFTHIESPHITNNLVNFVGFAIVFIILNQARSNILRIRWGRGFIWISLGAGIGAFFVEYLIQLASSRNPAYGFSGVSYGALGVLMAVLLLNLPNNSKNILNAVRNRKNLKRTNAKSNQHQIVNVMLTIGSPLVLIVFLGLIVSDPARFLSDAKNVDVLAHGIGFLIGFFGFELFFRRDFTSKRSHR